MYTIRAGALALILLSACAENQTSRTLPRGAEAYQVFDSRPAIQTPVNYRIGAFDTLDVNVFLEPELSVKGAQVDASGSVALPLIGAVAADGQTAVELSTIIARRYAERYLENPQVTVSILNAVSQRVTVQGEVTDPGIYDLKGPTTLLQSISLAKGETRVAALRSVSIFRIVRDQRVGAIFDIAAIRRGEQPDPILMGNDIVIVGYSRGKGIWRDTLAAAPLVNALTFSLLRSR